MTKPKPKVLTEPMPSQPSSEFSTSNLKFNNESASRINLVADMAVLWWIARRPMTWSLEQHIKTPTIGCITASEHKLAWAVADWCDFQGKKKNAKDQKKRVARPTTA